MASKYFLVNLLVSEIITISRWWGSQTDFQFQEHAYASVVFKINN